MERVVASLVDGDVVAIGPMDMHLDVSRPSDGPMSWRAFFSGVGPHEVEVGRQLRLLTTDGHSGEVIVAHVRSDGAAFAYTLQGTGPFI